MKNLNLSSNIWKIYLIKVVKSGTFAFPVLVLFLKENNLSMQEILLLQALFSVVVFMLNVPAGYFADRFGRKTSILVAGFSSAIGYLIYSLSYSFYGFLIAEIALGIGACFFNEVDNAILWDTLADDGRESEYQKVGGRNGSAGMISEGVTSFIGGFMALVSLRFPIYWDAGLTFLMVPLALTLVEPKRHKMKSAGSKFAEMLRIIKFALNDHKEIKWLIIYSAIVSASTLTMVWFVQVYWVATNVPLKFFGVLWGLLQFSSAFFSWNAHKIEKYLGRKKSLIALIAFPVLGYFLLGASSFIWSGIFILLFYVTRGIGNPVTSDYINGLVSSEERATILSIKDLVSRLVFSIVGPFVGWINDAISLKMALTSSGLIFLTSGAIALFFMHKHKAL